MTFKGTTVMSILAVSIKDQGLLGCDAMEFGN